MIESGARIEGRVRVPGSAIIRCGAVIRGEGSEVRLDPGVSINAGAYIGAANAGVGIGENTSIAPGVVISAAHHNVDTNNVKSMRAGDENRIEIGADCLIGANSVIQFGARIPRGCVIGALSLVTRSSVLEPGGIYAGRPVRFVRMREGWE